MPLACTVSSFLHHQPISYAPATLGETVQLQLRQPPTSCCLLEHRILASCTVQTKLVAQITLFGDIRLPRSSFGLVWEINNSNMGMCMSCCGGSRKGYDEEFNHLSGSSSHRHTTEQDREAQRLAAERAEARQQQFEKSAVGRAALKAVKDAKKQDAREANGGTARDWLS